MQRVKSRPVFLDLRQIRLPVAAVMSIIHRATGVVMVLSVPLLIYLLQLSLAGEEGFAGVAEWLGTLPATLLLFLFLWGLMHHLLAGIRYLLIDIDIGVEKPLYRQTAWAVIIAAPLLALMLTGGIS